MWSEYGGNAHSVLSPFTLSKEMKSFVTAGHRGWEKRQDGGVPWVTHLGVE